MHARVRRGAFVVSVTLKSFNNSFVGNNVAKTTTFDIGKIGLSTDVIVVQNISALNFRSASKAKI